MKKKNTLEILQLAHYNIHTVYNTKAQPLNKNKY